MSATEGPKSSGSPGRPPAPLASEPSVPGAGSVAGLAREVEQLRRAVERVAPVPGRVDELAKLVARLADTVAALQVRKNPAPPPSWLLAPTDGDTGAVAGQGPAGQLLDELTGWLSLVYLRYRDAAAALADCWLFHPDVVEELVWLMHTWIEAYQGSRASAALAAEWHDRWRPGVVRRTGKYLQHCSIEKHQHRGPGWDTVTTDAPVVPGIEQLDQIAEWWGAHREHPAPEPTGQQPSVLRPAAGDSYPQGGWR